jgi:hypothetical protein
VDPLLGDCSLAQLAKRKSHKWREYPPDVLPAFVAEMDYMVAEPIAAAIREALALGDTGYPYVGDLGEAFASFAAERLRWAVDPARVFPIPDVMTGIAEVLAAITSPGWVTCAAGSSRRHCGGAMTAATTSTSMFSTMLSPSLTSVPTCCATRTTRSARCGARTSC